MEYASKSKANAGLATGITGLSIAGLLALQNGGLGNLLGGFGGCNPQGINGVHGPVNAIDGLYHETCEGRISALQAILAEVQSERYTDTVGLELYKSIVSSQKESDCKMAENTKELYAYIIELSKEVALNKQATAYENVITRNAIECLRNTTGETIKHNQELNGLADASIISYVNSTFLPGRLYLPATSITPTVVTE